MTKRKKINKKRLFECLAILSNAEVIDEDAEIDVWNNIKHLK